MKAQIVEFSMFFSHPGLVEPTQRQIYVAEANHLLIAPYNGQIYVREGEPLSKYDSPRVIGDLNVSDELVAAAQRLLADKKAVIKEVVEDVQLEEFFSDQFFIRTGKAG
jgi:hypothetical protein